jgi:hypothetical protein
MTYQFVTYCKRLHRIVITKVTLRARERFVFLTPQTVQFDPHVHGTDGQMLRGVCAAGFGPYGTSGAASVGLAECFGKQLL